MNFTMGRFHLTKITDEQLQRVRLARGAIFLLGALACTRSLSAQAPASSAPLIGALKKLSFEQLMEIEVTSVSRSPEKLSRTPSAIQVVTGDEIRRSGASSIPE